MQGTFEDALYVPCVLLNFKIIPHAPHNMYVFWGVWNRPQPVSQMIDLTAKRIFTLHTICIIPKSFTQQFVSKHTPGITGKEIQNIERRFWQTNFGTHKKDFPMRRTNQ